VNPLNLSIANSDDEQPREIDTVGSSTSNDQDDREGKMTPMEIRNTVSASRKRGSGSASVRLPTSDEDEEEGEVESS